MAYQKIYSSKFIRLCDRVFLIFLFFIIIFESPATAQNGNSLLKTKTIKIITNYNKVSSISQLQNIFKGKDLFIDMWATWCHPCLEEFKSSDSLYKYLRSKDIELIYISIDKNEDDTKWKEILNSFKLSGNHVRSNKSLKDSLTTLIWGAIDAYSIPHYLFLSKSGKILNKDLPVISSGLLFKEIETSLLTK